MLFQNEALIMREKLVSAHPYRAKCNTSRGIVHTGSEIFIFTSAVFVSDAKSEGCNNTSSLFYSQSPAEMKITVNVGVQREKYFA